MSSPANSESLQQRARLVVDNKRAADRGTTIQKLCLDFWKFLQNGTDVDRETLHAFLDLLTSGGAFGLARLVIPEFRQGTTKSAGNTHQQWIMEQTLNLRTDFFQQPAAVDMPSDITALYEEEKHVFRQLEVYRAGVAIFGVQELNKAQEIEVERQLSEFLGPRPQISATQRSRTSEDAGVVASSNPDTSRDPPV